MGTVTKNQKQIKESVQELRHRLQYLKVRRGRREVYLNTMKKNDMNCTQDDDDDVMQQKQNKGVVGDEGPLASLSIAKAAAVATFAGNNPRSIDNTDKKDD